MTASAQAFTLQTSPTPGAPAQAPPRDPQQAQTGTAIVRGRMFALDTGNPLRRAQVRIFSNTLREQRLASTDAEGRYEFKDLPAGRYNLSASKGSYVALSYGQLRPFEPGKPLEIANGQALEKVDFSLPRGGVVTGRIFDEYGDPVADANVTAMRYAFQGGRRQLVNAGRMAQTTDIGEFRLFGLPPGQYYVSATMRNMMMYGASEDRSGYSPTYYPGTGSVGDAQRVTVSVGQVVDNINIPLVVARTSRVSGTVTDAEGKAATSGGVILMQRTGTMMGPGGAGQIHPDGTFIISNVAPGDYMLMANVSAGPGEPMQTATQKITVASEDVDGVRLSVARMATVTGKLVLNGAVSTAGIRGGEFRIGIQPADPGDFGFMAGGGNGTAKDDLTFQIRVRPCTCVVRAGTPGGWYLRSVRLNGNEVTDSGIDLRSDQDVSGLEIEMTNHPAELSGIVTDRTGDASRDYTLILFARDRERWNAGSRFIMTGRPDQDGRYKLRGVPAGDYYAIALDYVEQGEWTDPEFLDRVKANATAMTIGDSETKTLDLRLTTGS